MGMRHMADVNTYDAITFESVRKFLNPGMTLYDIGAYDGITSVIAAKIVGPENVVIVEPAEMNWTTIRAFWKAHHLADPKATYAGFLDERDKEGLDTRSVVNIGSFPDEANHSLVAQFEEGLNFRLLNDRGKYDVVAARPSMKFDSLAGIVGPPDGILMDVEGAEYLVLHGAEQTLLVQKPFVWISIHPKFMLERFMHKANYVHEYLEALGYEGTLLVSDHEEHWFFQRKP